MSLIAVDLLLAIEENQIPSAVFIRAYTRISTGERTSPRSIYNHPRASERAIKTCRTFRATDAGNIIVVDLYGLAAGLADYSGFQGHETNIQPSNLIGCAVTFRWILRCSPSFASSDLTERQSALSRTAEHIPASACCQNAH